MIEAWQGWAKAFPDSKATFVGEYASGDTAVLELVWKGTQTGPLQMPTGTIPPSNKSIEMPACQVVKLEGGKVKTVDGLTVRVDPVSRSPRDGGEGLAKGNPSQQAVPRAQHRVGARNPLDRARGAAERDKEVRFATLLNHVDNADQLPEACASQLRTTAAANQCERAVARSNGVVRPSFNGPHVRLPSAPIDDGREAARHRTPAGDTFTSVRESQGDRASLGIQNDAVGRDGRHRNSPLDQIADPEQLLPRTDPVLQDCESYWLGQDYAAKPPFVSDELTARRLRPARWRLRTSV
jgi:hypothetical protein